MSEKPSSFFFLVKSSHPLWENNSAGLGEILKKIILIDQYVSSPKVCQKEIFLLIEFSFSVYSLDVSLAYIFVFKLVNFNTMTEMGLKNVEFGFFNFKLLN